MSSGATETIHATCVAISGTGLLLIGPSGCGKSDLALRLLNPGCSDATASRLVSDDQVEVTKAGGRLYASPPASIAGRLEVRGVGIVTVPHVWNVELFLVIELVSPYAVPRLPDRDTDPFELAGVRLPRFRLAPFEASAPAKILAAADAVVNSTFSEDLAPDAFE